MSQPHPYAIFQCLMIQFNGEDASWESPGPFHRSASEHLGGSPGFGTKLRLSGFFSWSQNFCYLVFFRCKFCNDNVLHFLNKCCILCIKLTYICEYYWNTCSTPIPMQQFRIQWFRRGCQLGKFFQWAGSCLSFAWKYIRTPGRLTCIW